MNAQYRNYSLWAIRLLLSVVFIFSGVGKLIDSGYVNYDIIRLLSNNFFWILEYAAPIIIATSIIELLIAVLLLWGRYLYLAFSGALLMLLSFSSVLGYFYIQGMDVASCGCFGAFNLGSGLEFTLIRNAVLIILVIAGFFLKSKLALNESDTK